MTRPRPPRIPDPFEVPGEYGPVHRPMRTTYNADSHGNAHWYRRTFPGLVKLCPGYPRTCRLDADHPGECSTAVRDDEKTEF